MMAYQNIWLFLLFTKVSVYTYLHLRQVNQLKSSYDKVPDHFSSLFTLPEHQSSIDYALAKMKYGFIEKFFSWIILTTLVLSSVLGPYLNYIMEITPNIYFQTLLFFGILEGINTIISLPWSWYEQFHLEEKFGFNRMTPKIFVSDLLKNIFLSTILGSIILSSIVFFITTLPSSWSLFCGLFLILFQFILMWLYPTFLAPLFNKFTPLENGELRSDIETLFKSANRPAKDIYVMDASKRSAHGNAYFTGIGRSKRIVFFDTLLNKLSPQEIIGVLAHELGHLVHKHIIKMMVVSITLTFFSFIFLQYLSTDSNFYQSFNLPEHPAVLLLLASWWVPVLSFFVTPVMTAWSRKHEFEADHFAVERSTPGSLKDALLKLYLENKSPCVVDPLYASFYYSHPPLFERLARL